MKTRLLGGLTALAVAALAFGFAPVAQASTGSVPVMLGASSASTCWTSFDPMSPQGGPTTEYYYNCSNTAITVCPIYVSDPGDLSSSINYAYCNEAQTAGAWSTVAWHFASTFSSGDYSAAGLSDYAENTTGPEAPLGITCYTSFSNNDPRGQYMAQYYLDCSSYIDTICPIYTSDPGSLLTASNWAYCTGDEVQTVEPTSYIPNGYPTYAAWYFPTTFSSGNYTTALYG
jgi:hypothetical protein